MCPQYGAGDVVGIGIHTGNALRGYEVGRMARERGAYVVYGGIHAGLYPEEARELGGAHAVVRGDGDVVWGKVVADCLNGGPAPIYDAGQVAGCDMLPARWDLLPPNRYMWASVQTVRGCPKHCSFCSVWRTDGQAPRQRSPESIMHEAVELRRMGFRYLALSDDNFYPVSLGDLEMARRREDKTRLHELERLRAERLELMRRLAQLPSDTVMFTQITMEAAEDKEFLKGMHDARIKGALVGVESIGEEGLKSIYKGFNQTGEALVRSLQAFREAGVHVLGSFIFGLPSDTAGAWDATVALAQQASVTFAQFVILTPFPGTLDFARWEAGFNGSPDMVDGVPVTRHWLLPKHRRPKIFSPHPTMSGEEIRTRTQGAWDKFYSLPLVWQRARCVKTLRSRLAFVLISKLYRQMYANTGISTDSARVARAARWARLIAKGCLRLFAGTPMPELQVP